MTRKAQVPMPTAAMKADAIAKTLAMGRLHHVGGNFNAAEKCYRQVLALDPHNVDGLHLLGVIAFQSNHAEEGIQLIKRAAKKKPNDPAIFVNLGAAYRAAKRSADARDAYKTAIKLKPDLWEAYFNLGKALLDLADHEGAIAAYRNCMALKPQDAEAHLNLGNVYKDLCDEDKAIAAYEQALRLAPNMSQAYGNLGAAFFDKGWLHAALALMDKAVAVHPEPGELRFKRSLMALRLGQFSVGWPDYESRYLSESELISKPGAPPPFWAGENLDGKTIWLGTEQGIGDEILYASMVPDMIARAGHCVINCSRRMVPIFARSFPSATVVPHLSKTEAAPAALQPAALQADYQLALASLGQFLRKDFASFPRHQGYLKADPDKAAALRARYQAIAPGNLVVGISWRSKNDKIGMGKSADVAAWTEIFRVPGITFVNLQYGDCADDLAAVQRNLGVTVVQDLEIDPLKDMDGFFAQVAAMDFVVTTSNTTVHVAGSLNIPSLLMLSTGVDSMWYWFLNRDDSPWYPSVRILRRSHGQQDEGPWWREVVARAGRDLAAHADQRAALTARAPSQ